MDESLLLSPKSLIDLKRRPPQKQEKQIRAIIPTLQKGVRDLQEQHDELDLKLAVLSLDHNAPQDVHLVGRHAQLKIQLKEAQDDLAAHIICLSWALRLPVEVLEVIFILCLAEEPYIRPSRQTAPLLLCQICSMWRNVAKVTPALWYRLALTLSRPRGGWKDLLETWFGRSGTALLNFSLVQSASTPEADMAYFDDHVVKCLSAYSPRWKRLRLQAPPASLRALLKNRMLNLKILEVRVDNSSELFISSAEAPKLVQLGLSGDTKPNCIHVPWQRLTALRVKRPLRWDKGLELLRDCRDLRECQIAVSSSDAGGVIVPRVCMAYLSHVALSGSFGKDPTNKFFDAAEFPQLETLELAQTGRGSFSDSSLASFARRSPRLAKLTVKVGDIAVHGLNETVASIPSLKEVVLIRGYGLPWRIL